MTSLENGFTNYLSFGLNERVALVVAFAFLLGGDLQMELCHPLNAG